ncbi:hypothetical protein [Agrobacterium larrymoorei]|uniref:Uncharacterized protein n=1 Tax=Agrobacterium larrymoorei TaxID=160699 RepID=A0ABU0UMX2_9HYPH|nr:hypothetical protein [Agrobacterium larrymoorei]MDQ1186313.1 hypothetical protein [Agrobacterium larrymoorei]
MRIGMFILLASLSASPALAASTIKPGPSETDYMFQCGATFLINAHALNDGPKSAKARAQAKDYESRFNKLAAMAEASFEENRMSKSEALTYLQKHVDTMSAIFAKDPDSMKRFVTMCDARFPANQ